MTAERLHALREFVQAHQVTWNHQILNAIHRGARVQVGHEIELRASHAPSTARPTPGCSQCQELFFGLKALAEASFPPPDRPSRCETGPFDHSFHFDPAQQFHPEVVLRIQILHRDDYFKSIDACQNRCLEEIQRRLTEFGAQRGSWRRNKRQEGSV